MGSRILFSAAVALALVVGVRTVYRSGPHEVFGLKFGSKMHRTDFTVYYEAGRAVLGGQNIYEVENPRGWVYQYLPVFSVVMVPLAMVSVFWASLGWYVLSLAMVVHAVWLSVRVVRRLWPEHRLPEHWLAAAVVALLAWPIVSGLERGQTSPLIAWLVTVAVGCVLERAWWRGGAALAGAIVLKIFPALLVPFLAWKRQWRSVVAAGIWLAVLIFAVPSCVFGFEGNWKLLHQWWGAVARPANEPERALENRRFGQMINPRIDRNQSLQAVTIRWFGEGCERVARFAAMVVNLMLVLVSCVAMRCRAVQPRRLLPELCIVLVLMVVLAPVSWLHNFIVLLLPLAVAVGLGFGCGVKPMQVAVGAFAFAMFAARVVPACYKYGCVLLATLLLWAVFVWWTGRRGSVSTAGLV